MKGPIIAFVEARRANQRAKSLRTVPSSGILGRISVRSVARHVIVDV